jgi:flagellar motility protein MotE (MotC chaperone)
MMRRMAVPLALLLVAAGAAADELSAKVDMIVTGALGPQTDAERYCRNIADLAKEAKFEWQVKTIGELEDALAERTRQLEDKRHEVEDWLAKRQNFMAMAEERLVGIYSKMKPDAASAQIRELRPLAGAALLMKLQPRIASAILNEMPTEDAARLASLMIDAASLETPDAPDTPNDRASGVEQGGATEGPAQAGSDTAGP